MDITTNPSHCCSKPNFASTAMIIDSQLAFDRFRPLFQWLAIPWLQENLDAWVRDYNSKVRTKEDALTFLQRDCSEPSSADCIFRRGERMDFDRRGVLYRLEV